MTQPDQLRYVVFLTPDAMTSAAVTTVTGFVKAQYGVVSAGRFPPHVTLAGSLPLAVGEKRFLDLIGDVAAQHQPFEVRNAGLARLGDSLVYDIHSLNDQPNVALIDLVGAVGDAVRPLVREAPGLAADVLDRHQWRGHLSLASHELFERTYLRDEIEHFIHDLPVEFPDQLTARKLTAYRLCYPSWTGPWWTDFEWEYLRTFALGNPT